MEDGKNRPATVACEDQRLLKIVYRLQTLDHTSFNREVNIDGDILGRVRTHYVAKWGGFPDSNPLSSLAFLTSRNGAP